MIKFFGSSIAMLAGGVLAVTIVGCSSSPDSSSPTRATSAASTTSKASVAADYIDALNSAKAGPPPGKGLLSSSPDSEGFLKSVGPMPALAGFTDSQRLEMGKATCAALIRGVSSSRVEAIATDKLGNTGLVATAKLLLCSEVM
ncbi:hypothetical protein [Nocardia sp. NPDC004860]|uniref:hypothetical protein n=1 Tax=Nocardia sp. NPDC004860 TaxID=3154557 RepID=UPI0033B2CE7F